MTLSGDLGVHRVFWSRGAAGIGQFMTHPHAEHWCLVFSWIMFRRSFIGFIN